MAAESGLNANRLLAGLVDIIAAGNAISSQFDRLAREMSVEGGEPLIVFLSGLKKILRELPEKAFADKQARLAMIDAVQDSLDRAIELEEDMANAPDTPEGEVR